MRRDAGVRWRLAVFLAALIAPLVWLGFVDPIPQDLGYHNFADQRPWIGIPNAWNVLSNLGFLGVGLVGLMVSRGVDSMSRSAWRVMFFGVVLVCLGSGYYHWAPNDVTLVWDRLPMTLGFVGMVVALASERIDPRARKALIPAVLVGLVSVVLWAVANDLRLYLWVQFASLLALALLLVLFSPPRREALMLWAAFLLYAMAKVAEARDAPIYELTHRWLSGHSLKHLLGAGAVFSIVAALRARARAELLSSPRRSE